MKTIFDLLNISWVCDSGHSWLKVPMNRIKSLGIADKISSYSYMHGSYAYLEEDCDADIYLTAELGQDWQRNPGMKYQISNIPTRIYKNDAPCRGYASYGVKS